MSNGNVFISGASRGIGNSIAYHFAENDYVVVGTSRNEFEFDKKIKNLIPLKLDVTSREDIQNCFNDLKTKNLLPDILINNAGITSDQIFLRMKDEEWDKVIDTNLNGVFNLSKIFVKNMIKNKKGRIINISSISGLMGNPGQVNYSASKAGIIGFSKSLAKELASRNITVNTLCPGFIESDMTDAMNENQIQSALEMIPTKRFGTSSEVANTALFLASKNADYITGQTLSVDGGLFMH